SCARLSGPELRRHRRVPGADDRRSTRPGQPVRVHVAATARRSPRRRVHVLDLSSAVARTEVDVNLAIAALPGPAVLHGVMIVNALYPMSWISRSVAGARITAGARSQRAEVEARRVVITGVMPRDTRTPLARTGPN